MPLPTCRCPHDSLRQRQSRLGVAITPQALAQGFTAAAAACLKQGLDTALTRVIATEPVAIPLLACFTAVALQDSSTIVLPGALASLWQGCGGATAARIRAALKLQVRLEMQTGRLEVQLQDGRASDRAAALPGSLPAGALCIADVGYWDLESLRAYTSRASFGCRSCTRRPPSTRPQANGGTCGRC
jgi:hypothetical protein